MLMKLYDSLAGGDSMTSELKHHGVKGMKWGVRKKSAPKKKVETFVGKDSKEKLGLDGSSMSLSTTAISAIGQQINDARTRRKIARSLGYKTSELDKASLKEASSVVRKYKDVTVAIDGKSYNTSKKVSKAQQVKIINEGRERRRNEKLSTSLAKSRREEILERSHANNMRDRQYQIDYKYYKALGQSHSAARNNASLNRVASRIETQLEWNKMAKELGW